MLISYKGAVAGTCSCWLLSAGCWVGSGSTWPAVSWEAEAVFSGASGSSFTALWEDPSWAELGPWGVALGCWPSPSSGWASVSWPCRTSEACWLTSWELVLSGAMVLFTAS